MSSPQEPTPVEQPHPVQRPKHRSEWVYALGVATLIVACLMAGITVGNMWSAKQDGATLDPDEPLFAAALIYVLVIVGMFCLTSYSDGYDKVWVYAEYLEKKAAADAAAQQQRYDELFEKTKDYLAARRTAEAAADQSVITALVNKELGITPPDDKPAG